jgi:hypothetical protein
LYVYYTPLWIFIIEENRGAVVAVLRDVIRITGGYDPGKAQTGNIKNLPEHTLAHPVTETAKAAKWPPFELSMVPGIPTP